MEEKKRIIIEVDTKKRSLKVVEPEKTVKASFPVNVGTILKQGAIIYSFTQGSTCYFNIDLGDGTILRIEYPC